MDNEQSNARVKRGAARGFTLLEIIVVVTIIAILATLIAPRLLQNVDKAKVTKATQGVNTIAREVNIWLLDHGASTRLPDDFSLEVLTEGTNATLKKSQLIDPWNNAYVLQVPGLEGSSFSVVSHGADGQEGGESYDKDIYSE